ncbi:MAG: cupin domain-containing protein [Acidimicrobiales bacterium]
MDSLTFLPDRTPTTDRDDYYAALATYRDGGVFAAHYAGSSSWERHPNGDEIVLVLQGHTTLILLIDAEEVAYELSPMEFLIVPQGLWHRFETPDAVKVVSVTPQPTDHQLDRPSD